MWEEKGGKEGRGHDEDAGKSRVYESNGRKLLRDGQEEEIRGLKGKGERTQKER